MRKIKYIIVDDSAPKGTHGQHSDIGIDNLGHPFDECAIGIKYNGKLTDPRLRPQLLTLLDKLRKRYPEAAILAKNEYDRYHIKVREDMNQLRWELSLNCICLCETSI